MLKLINNLIILVMCMAPATVLGDCGDEPVYPEIVTVDIEANAL